METWTEEWNWSIAVESGVYANMVKVYVTWVLCMCNDIKGLFMVCLGIFCQGIKIYCAVSIPHMVTRLAVSLGFIPLSPALLVMHLS